MASDGPHQEAMSTGIDVREEGSGHHMTLMPKDLNIVWGRDPRYWAVPDADDKPAELLQVCWLEVTGTATNIKPEKNYEVIFELSLKPDAFGWRYCPVYVMVKRGKGGRFWAKRHQLTSFKESPFTISCSSMLNKLTDKEKQSKELYFGLYEVWSGRWKGGLQIHRAIVKEI